VGTAAFWDCRGLKLLLAHGCAEQLTGALNSARGENPARRAAALPARHRGTAARAGQGAPAAAALWRTRFS